MKATRKDIIEFTALMARESSIKSDTYSLTESLDRLCKLAKEYHTLAEAACNYELTPRQESRVANIEREAIRICAAMEVHVNPVFQNDPRGAPIKLQVPSGRTNDFGRIGIVVPF